MPKTKTDKVREHRIDMEIVVDCYDEYERVAGWHCYLEDNLQFPFQAKCIAKRAMSPLKSGDEVEVVGMADQEERDKEMFITIRWNTEELAVPLSQLQVVKADAKTKEAVEDWDYWVKMGYQF